MFQKSCRPSFQPLWWCLEWFCMKVTSYRHTSSSRAWRSTWWSTWRFWRCTYCSGYVRWLLEGHMCGNRTLCPAIHGEKRNFRWATTSLILSRLTFGLWTHWTWIRWTFLCGVRLRDAWTRFHARRTNWSNGSRRNSRPWRKPKSRGPVRSFEVALKLWLMLKAILLNKLQFYTSVYYVLKFHCNWFAHFSENWFFVKVWICILNTVRTLYQQFHKLSCVHLTECIRQGWPSFLCKAPTLLPTRVRCAINVGQGWPTFSVHAPKFFATQAFIWRCATQTFIAFHCSQTCSNIFILWSQNKAIFSGDLQKKKKGHPLFHCTFSITFGLNMPPNVRPTKCPLFFFFGDVIGVTNFSARWKDTYPNCQKNLKPGMRHL